MDNEIPWRHKCDENHNDPENGGPRIGCDAVGWVVFGGFLEWAITNQCDLDPSAIAGLAQINADYQQNEYLPRQAEVIAIYEFYNTTQDTTDRTAWDAECQAKAERKAEIDVEIYKAWHEACNAAYDLVGTTAHNAFLAFKGHLP